MLSIKGNASPFPSSDPPLTSSADTPLPLVLGNDEAAADDETELQQFIQQVWFPYRETKAGLLILIRYVPGYSFLPMIADEGEKVMFQLYPKDEPPNTGETLPPEVDESWAFRATDELNSRWPDKIKDSHKFTPRDLIDLTSRKRITVTIKPRNPVQPDWDSNCLVSFGDGPKMAACFIPARQMRNPTKAPQTFTMD